MSTTTTSRKNVYERRSAWTTDMYDQAAQAGITNHSVRERTSDGVILDDGKTYTEFVSCSYLGLESHPRLVHAAQNSIRKVGVHLSASRNSMHTTDLDDLEEALTTMYGGSRAIVFNSVSSVHLGVLPLLGTGLLPSYPIASSGPEFLFDRTAHASMQSLRGILDQIGPTNRFDSTDLSTLDPLLVEAKNASRSPIILVDGVGSMGGLIDVATLARLAAEHGGYVYIDDAHGTSIDGRLGTGYAYTALAGNIIGEVLLVGSLSKAFGGSGGFALVDTDADATVIRREANPLVFGHANMAPHTAVNAESARMHLDGSVEKLQATLWDNVAHFDNATGHQGVNAGSRSPIRGITFDSEQATLEAAIALKDAGVLCFPVFYPIVAHGTGLLRFALSARHSPAQIDHLAALVTDTP
ncbi:7-keto-8-aminopelargonate synthetase [Corynebacterium appendicis CIP 107643]|uniref:8-amino-7-oxononanoate synthase n=1 Tax=Corynebacterium appendicis CIP 107643 TaxID=1161099 RepID=A0A1N7IVE9_9CORY|nr:aminotransferase class I/II-fold pyridoxal phosphate-dependent enzyme [Corynebacterium appendicis]WJY61027.1 Putative pyridoxal phosphate-dependent acyltransferase [Corynebacterium appendicis CIP 107643]SIS41063.1 7-keto-8-aminopelargonate synthetase [Corynebacterium appendicis CIP 107643]